ncbi:ABC transporter permease [Sinorhizobium meliloti]|uniref:ABC transporter permease n=1 Tax=Rhizobium meliloti TaxID=382 RepID=UPI000B49A2BF|nr:ABC transporter permease [Sinorhizobium meliloti]ASP73297.1 ABC transporter permease [Sinorhizobium meliloti]MDE3854411.1 ABC transporter permease [Sinorhizobium meliloti]MQW52874.1 ABC transporter permease subunit [Sinorhizobium meliloti]
MRILRRQIPVGAIAGAAIVFINIVAVVMAPSMAPAGEGDMVGTVWAPPSSEYWLGLDNLGRDIFSRLLFGGRTTIVLALVITLLSCSIGVAAGFAAAVKGGWVDTVLSRSVDALLAIPGLIFSLVILSVFGSSVPVLIITIAVLSSPGVFRVSRAVALGIAAMDYVEVARLRGERLPWIMRSEILPNAMPSLMAEFGLRFCFALLFVAALSFLGLGIQPPYADWGGMVRDNAQAINFGSLAPLIPAFAIAQLTIGVNLLVDGFLPSHGRTRGD